MEAIHPHELQHQDQNAELLNPNTMQQIKTVVMILIASFKVLFQILIGLAIKAYQFLKERFNKADSKSPVPAIIFIIAVIYAWKILKWLFGD